MANVYKKICLKRVNKIKTMKQVFLSSVTVKRHKTPTGFGAGDEGLVSIIVKRNKLQSVTLLKGSWQCTRRVPRMIRWFCFCVLCLAIQWCLTLRPHGRQPARLLCPCGFSRQDYWRVLPRPPPGIFPTQGWNPGLSNCRWIRYSLSHQGSRVLLLGENNKRIVGTLNDA